MIDKKKINACAENIVKCVKVSEDDCVYIRGGIYCQDLLEEVALNVLRKGGLPHITSSSDNYAVTIYQDDKIKTRTLEKTPNHVDHLELMFETFPQASVVHIIRHPVDVYASMRKRAQVTPLSKDPWLRVGHVTFAQDYIRKVDGTENCRKMEYEIAPDPAPFQYQPYDSQEVKKGLQQQETPGNPARDKTAGGKDHNKKHREQHPAHFV